MRPGEQRGQKDRGEKRPKEAEGRQKKPYSPPDVTRFGPVEEHTGPEGISR